MSRGSTHSFSINKRVGSSCIYIPLSLKYNMIDDLMSCTDVSAGGFDENDFERARFTFVYPKYDKFGEENIFFFNAGNVIPTRFPATTFEFRIDDKLIEEIDITQSPVFFSAFKAKYLGSNYGKSLENLKEAYDTYNWGYIEFDPTHFSDILDDNTFLLPHIRYNMHEDNLLLREFLRNNEYSALKQLTLGQSKDSVCENFNIPHEQLDMLIKYFNENGHLPHDHVVKKKLVIPRYSEIREILDSVYKDCRYTDRSWPRFCSELGRRFPMLDLNTPGALRQKTKAIRNLKRDHHLKVVKVKTIRAKQHTTVVLDKVLCLKLMMCNMMFMDESPVFFMATEDVSPHKIDFRAVTTGNVRPVYALESHSSVYLTVITGKYGLFSAWISSEPPDVESALGFLFSAKEKYHHRYKYTGPLMLVLNNNIRFKSSAFKNPLKGIGYVPIYVSYPEFGVNMANTYIESLQRFLGRHQIVDVTGVISVVTKYIRQHINKCWWIHKRYYDSALHSLQIYRCREFGTSIPKEIKTLVISREFAHLWENK